MMSKRSSTRGADELASQEVLEYLGRNTREISQNLPQVKREKKTLLLNHLCKAYLQQDLVLVLGAGVSIGYGIPNWNTLLQKLLVNTFEEEREVAIVLSKLFTNVFNPHSVIAGRYLQNHFRKSDKGLLFENEVRKVLYNSANKAKNTSLIKEIAKFCIAPGKTPNLDSIITYNYDDILENYLDTLNLDIPYRSIYGVGMSPSTGELPIYHVHGMLPEKGDLDQNNEITLGEGIYHEQYSDIYSWHNITQINKFRDKTCLFIGTSLTDPNVRRLLDIARIQKGDQNHYHYILKKKYHHSEVKATLEGVLEKDRILLDEKSSTNLKLDDTTDLLIEIIERFEENDALSFGVKTIWLNDFSDYPKVLKSIKDESSVHRSPG